VIVDNNVESNNYFFTIVTTTSLDGNTCNQNCKKIIFNKMKFIPSGSSGTLEQVTQDLSSFTFSEEFVPYLSCNMMIKDGNEYIACFFGKENLIVGFVFNFNYEVIQNQTYVGSTENPAGGKFFKSVVLPTTREKALICSYQSKFLCVSYNINTNSFGEYIAPIGENECQENNLEALIVEYFYETERFIVGCIGNSNSIVYLSEF
jgi:hypothetical protein